MSTASKSCIPLIDVLERERLRALGALTVEMAAKKVSLPLSGVDIQAHVVDRVAQVTVKEVFRNPYSDHLEATYIFPLPGGAAVSAFEMRVADRVIRGQVKERAQAREDYARAIESGKRAALLEQERDDVFTVQVGNLPPGEEITIVLTYSERLPFFENGSTELRLPLVVAPRYIAGQPLDRDQVGTGVELDTDLVPDASRMTPPRLVEGFDPKVALGISVELSLTSPGKGRADSGGSVSELQDLCCSQHTVRTSLTGGAVKISLSRDNEPLNRDFVLRWRLWQDTVCPTILYYRDPAAVTNLNADAGAKKAKGGTLTDAIKKSLKAAKAGVSLPLAGSASSCYAMLSLVPPVREGYLGAPRDVVFVLDRSGSMRGVKMVSAARACSILLATLGPQDRFAINAFDNVCEWMPDSSTGGGYFVDADEAGVERGNKYLRNIGARGGTELNGAVEEAIEAISRRQDKQGRVPVIVILTDGQVGDESHVLKKIQQKLGDSRVFTVGIDTAVNEGFLKRIASLGGGTCTFVQPGEQLELALSSVAREIGHPLITDVSIEDINCGIERDTVAPGRIPDLFEGRATTCFFRFQPSQGESLRLRIKGKYADGSSFVQEAEAQEVLLPAVAQLWAKAHIADLEDRFRTDTREQSAIRQKIVDLSIKHSVLTRFTAFVVVDEAEVVNKDGSRRTVVQPVEMPASWDMKLRCAPAGFMQAAGRTIEAELQAAWVAPASPPAPPSVSDSWGSTAGTYGSGIRSQVFEVIVRKAMSGEPWRETCLAPMRVNNITAEEVAREVDRRQAMARSSSPSSGAAIGAPQPVAPGKSPDPKSLAARHRLEKAVELLSQALVHALSELVAGRVPAADPIEKGRAELMAALADHSISTEVPLLQRFLRTEMVEFVAALRSKRSTIASLQKQADRYKEAFNSVRTELDAALRGRTDSGAGFWEATI